MQYNPHICSSCGSDYKHKPDCARVIARRRAWTPPKPGTLRAKIHNLLVSTGRKKRYPNG